MPQTNRARSRMARRTYDIFHCRDAYPDEQMLHHHDFYEVNLLLAGSVTYNIESRVYHLTVGDLLLIGPNELHQPIQNEERGGCERLIVWIDKAYLQQYANFGFDLTACFDNTRQEHTNCLRFADESMQRVAALMERCIEENASEDFGSRMMADTLMVQIMILINRMADKGFRPGELRDKSDSLVSNVLGYINDHYAEELTLDALANKFFISKYHLSREFVRLAGTSVHRYITQKRLVIAKQLLSEGKPSSAVYQQCGFGDYSNFYRAFKAEYGISPKEFVDNVRSDAAYNAERLRQRSWVLTDSGEE